MNVLLLKLFLAPVFVVAASLVARRFGPRLGGIVGGLPVVAGPILLVLALTHSRAFAAEATSAAILSLVSLAGFVVAFGALTRHTTWPVALTVSIGVFLASTATLTVVTPSPLVAALVVYIMLAVALAVVPRPRAASKRSDSPRWDLPLRAAVAAAMVVALSAVSGALGPQLSGLLAPFPIITSILAAFTLAQRGPEATLTLLRGMLAGFYVFATTLFIAALALGA